MENREIKFRLRGRHDTILGYEKWYEGEWNAEGGYWKARPCWLYSTDNKNWAPKHIPHRYKDAYTGLKDKNEVEIYEGDCQLLDYGRGKTIAVVEWSNDDACFIYRTISNGFLHPCRQVDAKMNEVIGNIYENKELLDGLSA